MVAFTGRCLAHRAGIMQLHGEWRDALEEARLARERCEQAMNRAATGQALYQQGELHRLQGDRESAEAAYGKRAVTAASLSRASRCCGSRKVTSTLRRRRSAGSSARRPSRSSVRFSCRRTPRSCSPSATATRRGARATSWRRSRAGSGRPMLEAIAAHVRGAVELGEGDAEAALAPLRRA